MKQGTRIALITEHIAPHYLAGAVIEVEEENRGRGTVGRIISFTSEPPLNARFRVGGTIRFTDSLVDFENQPPQQDGKPAPRIISVRNLLEMLDGAGLVITDADHVLEQTLQERGMTMDTAFTYDAQVTK